MPVTRWVCTGCEQPIDLGKPFIKVDDQIGVRGRNETIAILNGVVHGDSCRRMFYAKQGLSLFFDPQHDSTI